jgi:MFS superfamily sulfate permease-like transporter
VRFELVAHADSARHRYVCLRVPAATQLPIARTIATNSPHSLRCTAYAYLTGVQPQYGLFSSVVPLIVYFFMGQSRLLSIGPEGSPVKREHGIDW